MERLVGQVDIAELIKSGNLTVKLHEEILRRAHDDPLEVRMPIDGQFEEVEQQKTTDQPDASLTGA